MDKDLIQENSEKSDNGDRKNRFFAEMFDWISSIFSAILCFVIIFWLFAKIITVDGQSMVPTLQDQDRLIVSDLFYQPQYGDIVVVYADKLHAANQDNTHGKPIIKRVIGLEGDTIRIDFYNGIVYRNGEALEEDYTNSLTNIPEDMVVNENYVGEVTVEPGKIFVLGDNRNNSTDSRSNKVGQVDKRYIMGKAYVRVWPFNQFGLM